MLAVETIAATTVSASEEADGLPQGKKKRRFCPHCLQTVGYSTFFCYRDRYYDVDSNQWTLVVREEDNKAKETNAVYDCHSEDSRSDNVHSDDFHLETSGGEHVD